MPPLGIQIGISGGSSTSGGFNPSDPGGGFTGILDTYTGAAAAYSVRRLSSSYTGGLIRVRRSSDDAEQDIGYDSNGEDLDTFGLLAFVNADVDTYTSDFSSGTDSFSEHSTTNAGNIDGVSDGTTSKDDVLRVTMTGGSTSHQIRRANIFDGANTYDISFEYYIPSANTKLDQIVFRTNVGGDGDTAFSNVGTWSTGSISDFTPSGTQVRFNATDGGAFIFDADGDVFYLKNIVVTQTTADGAVTTWYDQTGNGNNATNSTASEQPLIVSGGTLVEENSKAAIDFDGSNDTLLSSTSFAQPYTAFAVRKFDSNADQTLISHNTSTFYSVEFRFVATTRLSNGNYLNHSVSPTTTQGLLYALGNGSNSEISIDGGTTTTGNSGSAGASELSIGGRSSYHFNGALQEIIYFDSDQSDNRGTVTAGGGTDIEGNINTYFDIV